MQNWKPQEQIEVDLQEANAEPEQQEIKFSKHEPERSPSPEMYKLIQLTCENDFSYQ